MLRSVSTLITTANRKIGEFTSLLILPLLAVVVYEVFMRYAFNAPTIWGFEATVFLYGIHFLIGYAYTDCLNGHVRVDVLTMRLQPRTRAILEIFTLLVLFFPFLTLMTLYAGKFAQFSFNQLELNSTSWAPPIWPFKIIMALGFLILWLQGLASLITNVNIVVGEQAD